MDTLKKLIKNKYLTLVPPNASKEKIKTYEELWQPRPQHIFSL